MSKSIYARRSIWTSLALTLFFFNLNIAQDEGRWIRTKAIEDKSLWVHKIISILNRLYVFNCLINVLPVPAFKFGPSLNYIKQGAKELVTIK